MCIRDRFSHLYRGVFPFVYESDTESEWTKDVESRLNFGIAKAKEFGMLKEGDTIVTIQGFAAGVGHSNTLRVLTV